MNRESRSSRARGAWQLTAALLCSLLTILPRLAWAEPSPAPQGEQTVDGSQTSRADHVRSSPTQRAGRSAPSAKRSPPPTPTPEPLRGRPADNTPSWLRGAQPKVTAIEWAGKRMPENRSLRERLLFTTTLPVRALILIGLGLLLWRWRAIRRLARRVRPAEWRFVAFWSLVGVALRLIGGVRVPGFTSSSGCAYGFALLRDVVVRDPYRNDPHGNGFHALHGMTTWLLPNRELSVVAVQLAMSVLCVPLTYVVARFWHAERRGALWAAAVVAILPTQVYFATTEIRLLPGTFFLLLTLAACGLSTRDEHVASPLAAAVLGAVTTQFYPTLMILPLVALLFLISRPAGRALFGARRAWLAAAVFLALFALPAAWTLSRMATEHNSVVGRGFLLVFDDWPGLFRPTSVLAADDRTNVFLSSALTPPTLWVLALGAVAIGAVRRELRIATVGMVVCALLFTLVGRLPGRLNLARLQHAAGPFYAMLAGMGLAEALTAVARLLPRGRASARLAVGGGLLAASIAIWPGPIGRLHALQWDRRVVVEGLPHLGDGCAVLWPPGPQGTDFNVPTYLAVERDKPMDWGAIRKGRTLPPELLERAPCLYYFRPSACYSVTIWEERSEALRPECAAIEQHLDLQPAYVRQVVGTPDDMAEYPAEWMDIGFFEVRQARSAVTDERGR